MWASFDDEEMIDKIKCSDCKEDYKITKNAEIK